MTLRVPPLQALNPASPELQEELGHALRLRAAVAGAEEAMGRGEGGLAAEIYAEAAKHTVGGWLEGRIVHALQQRRRCARWERSCALHVLAHV